MASGIPADGIAIEVRSVSKSFTVTADRRSSFKERFVRGKAKHKTAFHALDNVSFSIKKGTTFGLIGHNGSGKSTMLKILAGVYSPTSGQVLVDGKVDALLELGAGFHGELTGRENIYLNGAILGRSKKQIDDTLEWIIDYADIGAFIDEPVKVYSSGMTVRLGFAVAVAVRPEILIVDEIIAVGDEEFQRKCFELMRRLRNSGTTIALVTHSLNLAREMCDEVIWLDHGRVRSVGSADEVISGYLAEVNEAENAKNHDDSSADDALRLTEEASSRQGSGECRMTRVEYLDERGHPVHFLSTEEGGTIRVHYAASTALANVEVGLAIITDSGHTIAGPNSKHSGVLFDIPPGEGYVDYRFDDLIIEPGSYSLSVAFVHEGHIYDYADRLVDLTIRSTRVMDEPGLVILPRASWMMSVAMSEVRVEGANDE